MPREAYSCSLGDLCLFQEESLLPNLAKNARKRTFSRFKSEKKYVFVHFRMILLLAHPQEILVDFQAIIQLWMEGGDELVALASSHYLAINLS